MSKTVICSKFTLNETTEWQPARVKPESNKPQKYHMKIKLDKTYGAWCKTYFNDVAKLQEIPMVNCEDLNWEMVTWLMAMVGN